MNPLLCNPFLDTTDEPYAHEEPSGVHQVPLPPLPAPERHPVGLDAFDALIRSAAMAFLVDPDSVRYGGRSKSLVHARHVVAWVARERWGCSYPELGRLLGGKDHTSMMHAVRNVSAEVQAGSRVGRVAMALKEAT